MVNRRTALQSLIAATLVGAAGAPRLAPARQRLIKPARLRPGQTIGLVTPASNTPENEDIETAADIVRSLGFSVKKANNIYARTSYLAGSDEDRARDLNAMFADDDVAAIFCVRGGYGTTRILPYLDYALIRANPKVLMGYSDITGLLNAIFVKTGLVGFHGPNALDNFSDYALGEYEKVLLRPAARTVIGQAPPFATRRGRIDRQNRLTRITRGKARGRLIGGNLTLLTAINGTPYEPDYSDSILFLEDISEAPYRVDRMLTELWLSGHLDRVRGIAIGKFTDFDSGGNQFSMEEVFRMRFEPLGVPTLRGLMIGHIDDQTTVPIGIEAELDADAGTLTLMEAAVS